MRGLTSRQGGTAEGGGPTPGRATVNDRCEPTRTGRSQGEGDRSPWSLLVGQVHDGLGPSDVLVVRQVANALDAKRLVQGVGMIPGQAQRGHWGVGQSHELVHIRLVVWGRVDVGVLNHPWLSLLAPLDNLTQAVPDVSAGGGRGSALCVPASAGAGGRARVRGRAAGRWRGAGRRCRDARRRTLALAVGA